MCETLKNGPKSYTVIKVNLIHMADQCKVIYFQDDPIGIVYYLVNKFTITVYIR